MFRLAASDIDGTLVHEGSHVLDPSYYGLIRKMKEMGIAFCACSGRQYASILHLFSPVADDIYFIAENGTILRTRERILHTWLIDKNAILPLMEDVRRIEGTRLLLCSPDCTFVDAGEDSYVYHVLKDKYRYELLNVPDLTALPLDNITKITVFHEEADAIFDRLSSSPAGRNFQMAASGKTWIDICTKDAGKGSAFSMLQKLLDVRREETIYFGDNMNDLPAFAEAGFTGTVSNARPEIRERADLVAGPFEELGVLSALQRLLGL